jgi:hypothetical protein
MKRLLALGIAMAAVLSLGAGSALATGTEVVAAWSRQIGITEIGRPARISPSRWVRCVALGPDWSAYARIGFLRRASATPTTAPT